MLKKFKKIAGISLSCLILASCANQTLTMKNIPEDQDPTVNQHQWFFLGGIDQEDAITPADICGSIDNVGKITFDESWWRDGLITFFTFGIVTPRQVEVYCVNEPKIEQGDK